MGRRIHIAVSLSSPGWRDVLPDGAALGRRAARAALRHAFAQRPLPRPLEALPPATIELGLVLADDDLLHRLNRQYRGVDRPTNVLSFGGLWEAPAVPSSDISGERAEDDRPLMLGDVVLACETIVAEAAAQGKTVADHFSHLVVHGVLHLLGYDHEEAAEAEAMEGLEVSVLAQLGIANPYSMEVDSGPPARA